ncbi:ferric-chelate reductase [Limtongia smithiae]|uniref:ferric-chelate reductase n=1 Tax=Limtongia smithiae TaxID=1125753 RepID=UPI0034CD4D93
MRCLAIVQFAILAVSGVQAKRGYGFVGYGIQYEKPSCAFACREAISGATLSCSTTTNMDIITDMECYTTNDVFLQTLALCVSTRCSSTPVWSLERYWEGNVAGSADVQPDPKETYQQSLAKINGIPTAEYSETGWLNETSIVAYELWFANYNTDVAFEEQESQQVKYGLVILLSGFIIPIGFSLLRFFPFPCLWRSKFYALVIDPPVVGTKRNTPVFFNLLLVPSRGQAGLILYFIVLNTVLSAVNYNDANPNTWYPSDQWRWMIMLVSDRLGLLSFANLPLVFLYGGRNNILLWLTNWSHSTFLLLHRWIAAIATLQAILHSLIYLHAYVRAGTHASESREPYWYWGIVATLGLFILFPSSVIPIRTRFYEIFLAWHVIISILVVAGCYWHIVFKFSHEWGYETWIIMCMAIWTFDRVFRFLRLARFGVRIATITTIDNDYMRITIPDVSSSGHAYIYFPTLTWRVWENHPFSVACSILPTAKRARPRTLTVTENNDEKQYGQSASPDASRSDGFSADIASEAAQVSSTFYVRLQRGITSRLQGKISVPVLLETGYSSESLVSESVNTSPTLIAIAGGVGFTGVLPSLLAHTGRVKLYWGCRTESLVNDVQRTFALSRIEMETFIGTRMNIREILETEIDDGIGDVCVIVCGPASMADETRTVFNSIVKYGCKISARLVVESFSW